jgi:hypothetical protein
MDVIVPVIDNGNDNILLRRGIKVKGCYFEVSQVEGNQEYFSGCLRVLG